MEQINKESKRKLRNRLLITHTALLVYTIIMLIIYYTGAYTVELVLFDNENWRAPLWSIVILTYIFELTSTLTFQLRMKLTSKYEVGHNKKLIELIPLIAAFSWGVAGISGIIFFTSTPYMNGAAAYDEALLVNILKLTPIFIATYNGVYTTLILKKVGK